MRLGGGFGRESGGLVEIRNVELSDREGRLGRMGLFCRYSTQSVGRVWGLVGYERGRTLMMGCDTSTRTASFFRHVLLSVAQRTRILS